MDAFKQLKARFYPSPYKMHTVTLNFMFEELVML